MSDQLSLLQKHFDTALESPDGIKKLRNLILTLAMQGKLVKQDPKDQPASALLKEIQAEKERLIKKGKIKKQKELPPIKTEEVPYAVPEGWVWTRLTEIADLQTGATPSTSEKEYYGGDIRWLVSGDINQGQIYNCNGRITTKGLNNSNCKVIPENSLLIALNGQGKTRATVAMLRVEAALNQSLIAIIPSYKRKEISEFLFWNFRGRYKEFRNITGDEKRSGLNMKIISKIIFPLPPLSEQKRIVAKIDELMAHCDKLEAQRNARNDKRLAVHTAAINHLLTAADANDFDSACQFMTCHFDPLYSVKENVAVLKKAILTLAMQGKLVKQDPRDQPASELLKEIQAEKERLIKEGRIKKQKVLPPIKPGEVPYEVPEGWEWVRLGDFIFLEMGQSPDSRSYNQINKGIPFFQGKADFGKINPTPRYWCTQPSKIAFKGDILLSVRAPVGPTNISNIDCCIGRGLAALRPFKNVQSVFVNYLMMVFRQTLESKATGTTFVAVSKNDVENLIIPIPPLSEQKRIVAKIDELMDLCDKLEKQIEQATAKQTALFDAVLAKM